MSDSIINAMNKNYSFWQHKYGNYKANDALLKGQYEVDVLIVSAGFTGLIAAREIMRNTPEKKVMRWGKSKAQEAQNYMQQVVAYVHELVEKEKVTIR
jgi:hypothetical protein